MLLRLFRETLEELSLGRVMASAVALRGDRLMAGGAEVNVTEPERIFVAAIGKAARPMCESIAPMLPADRTSFAVVAPGPAQPAPQGMRAFAGGHPYPNTESEAAARHVLATARELGSQDLLICLLSGGGSAICEAPLDPEVSLEDLKEFFRVLVTCGGNIVEMNVLRKHLSLIKGGRLAEAAAPARQLTLYVSDVPAGEPSSVASGPTMPDESTSEDAYDIAARLGIVSRLPPSIRRRFERRDLPETPKPGGEAFRRGQWACLLDNSDALESLESKLTALGWILERDLSVDDQPVDEAADTLLDRLEALAAAHPGRTVAVTTGGELSSPVTGDGMPQPGVRALGGAQARRARDACHGPECRNRRNRRELAGGRGHRRRDDGRPGPGDGHGSRGLREAVGLLPVLSAAGRPDRDGSDRQQRQGPAHARRRSPKRAPASRGWGLTVRRPDSAIRGRRNSVLSLPSSEPPGRPTSSRHRGTAVSRASQPGENECREYC